MNRLSRLVVFLLAVSATPMALASDGPGPREDVTLSVTVASSAFTTIALNTSQTMDSIQVSGLRFVTFYMKYVYNAGTAVNMTCLAGPTSADVVYKVQALAQSSGTLTSYDATFTKATGGASQSFPWTVATNGYAYIKCTWSASGSPTVSDTLTVKATGSVY